MLFVGKVDALWMAADLPYNPKESVFDELGMRRKNQLFLEPAPLKMFCEMLKKCLFQSVNKNQ